MHDPLKNLLPEEQRVLIATEVAAVKVATPAKEAEVQVAVTARVVVAKVLLVAMADVALAADTPRKVEKVKADSVAKTAEAIAEVSVGSNTIER